MNYQGKQVAVLGAGRSGEAAALLLIGLGARVTVFDDAEELALGTSRVDKLRGLGMRLVTGAAAEQDAAPHDLAVLSPGIDPNTELVQNFMRRGIPVVAEIELAFQSSPVPVIGITGTNGKTTTTELVAAMLTGAGVHTEAGGNLGKPYSEIAAEGKELNVVTLEVSSFQLERIREFRPAISVWLNLTPDHLDRYRDAAEYRQAKLRVFENQTRDDWAVVNFRAPLPELSAKRLTFSAYEAGADLHLHNEVIHYKDEPLLDPRETFLRGQHNTENLMAALGVGLAWGLTAAQMNPGLRGYRPPPHRGETVREIGQVRYINDSKATNLDALEKALASCERPVILIAGGKDKGRSFEGLAELVASRVRWAVLIGETADAIRLAWQDHLPCEKAGSLPEAVNIAWSLARPGELVLFSPGTSSFDQFKSYADRGNQFKALVQALPAAE